MEVRFQHLSHGQAAEGDSGWPDSSYRIEEEQTGGGYPKEEGATCASEAGRKPFQLCKDASLETFL